MLWRIVVERARMGAEKRDRSAILAVAADDLEGAFSAARTFLASVSPGFRIRSAQESRGAVEVLDGQRDLCGGEVLPPGVYPMAEE